MENKQKTIVFKVSDNIKDQMIEHYQDMVTGKPPYSIFQVKQYDCVITLYESGKKIINNITIMMLLVVMKLVLVITLDLSLLQLL